MKIQSTQTQVAAKSSAFSKSSILGQTAINNVKNHNSMTIDIKRFRSRWAALTSEEEFDTLLGQYDISPLQAFELVGDTWAAQVPVEALLSRLELLVELGLNCTITAANEIATFAFSGKIESTLERNGQLILLTHSAQFCFNKAKIDSAWIVKKPNSQSSKTSLELFNRTGTTLVKFAGCCEHNKDEMDIWENLTQTIPIVDEVINRERVPGFTSSNHRLA